MSARAGGGEVARGSHGVLSGPLGWASTCRVVARFSASWLSCWGSFPPPPPSLLPPSLCFSLSLSFSPSPISPGVLLAALCALLAHPASQARGGSGELNSAGGAVTFSEPPKWVGEGRLPVGSGGSPVTGRLLSLTHSLVRPLTHVDRRIHTCVYIYIYICLYVYIYI